MSANQPRGRAKPIKRPGPLDRTCPRCGDAVVLHGSPEHLDPKTLTPHTCRSSMTAADDFLTRTEIKRDRWGRPILKRADGKGTASYQRVTTFVGCLEDTYNLGKWQQRMVATGLATRPDLVMAVAAHHDDKNEMNKLCEQAMEAANAHGKATLGTALHRIIERIDAGEKVAVPEAAKKDVAAYRKTTADWSWTLIERLLVNDELGVAGTPDRNGIAPGEHLPRVADLKTGSLDFGMGKIAMQLAVYAHSDLYDDDTGERTPLNVRRDYGVVIHLPAGEGRCELVEVDLVAGWEAVQLARQVHAWRKRKNLSGPFVPGREPLDVTSGQIATLLEAATTVEALREVWAANKAAWNDELSALANDRKAALSLAHAS